MLDLLLRTAVGMGVTLGLGAALLGFLERRRGLLREAATLGDVGFLGVIALTLIGTGLNFFTGLSPWVTSLVAALGLVLLLLRRRRLLVAARIGSDPFITALIVLVVALVVVRYAYFSASTHYDTGLYHLQAILEANDGPVVLGIANLHFRLGYNTLLFLGDAMLTGPVFGVGGAYLVNPLIMIFAVTGVAQRVLLATQLTGYLRSLFFGLALLAVFSRFGFLLGSSLGSPDADVASNLMVPYAVFLALFLSDSTGSTDRKETADGVAMLLPVLVLFGITVKVADLPLVLLAVPVLAAWRRGAVLGEPLAVAAAACLLLGLLWIARGVATSGCLLYPEPVTCLPVPWRIDPAVAQSDMEWIRSWARRPAVLPQIVLADWSWLPDWLRAVGRDPFRKVLIMLAPVAGACVAVSLVSHWTQTVWHTLGRWQKHDSVWLFLLSLVGFAFWFLSAPLVRYGMGWIVLPLLLTIAHAAPWPRAPAATETSPVELARHLVFDLADATVEPYRRAAELLADPRRLLAMMRGGANALLHGYSGLRCLAVVGALLGGIYFFSHPRSALWAHDFPLIVTPRVATEVTRSGLRVSVPVGGFQCWAMPRPCTPDFSKDLELDQFGYWRMMRRAPP